MEEQVHEVFGQHLFDVLERYGFHLIGGIDDDGWFTRDYVNRDFGIHLTYHLNDRLVDVMCLDYLEIHHGISSIYMYFTGGDSTELSPSDQAQFIDQHYKRIARMLRRRDGGADLRGLHEFDRTWMKATFGIDLPKNPIELERS